jgi:hypothetical protein
MNRSVGSTERKLMHADRCRESGDSIKLLFVKCGTAFGFVDDGESVAHRMISYLEEL